MINGFIPSTQSMRRLTIFLLALPSSCKIWNFNVVLFKDIGNDIHIISEEIYFMILTSTITTCGILFLTLHPLGFQILNS